MPHPLPLRAWSSLTFRDAQTPVTLEFFVPVFGAVTYRRILTELVRKLRCTATSECVRVYSSMQKAFPAQVATIFTALAPLAATYETNRPQHVRSELTGFLFLKVGGSLKSLPLLKYTDILKCVTELRMILYKA